MLAAQQEEDTLRMSQEDKTSKFGGHAADFTHAQAINEANSINQTLSLDGEAPLANITFSNTNF